MKRLILLGVLVLFLAACGSSEKTVKEIGEVEVIRIVEVTREVEVTRVVEVKAPINVIVEVTPVPTAMPIPTPTATNTPEPTLVPVTLAEVEMAIALPFKDAQSEVGPVRIALYESPWNGTVMIMLDPDLSRFGNTWSGVALGDQGAAQKFKETFRTLSVLILDTNTAEEAIAFFDACYRDSVGPAVAQFTDTKCEHMLIDDGTSLRTAEEAFAFFDACDRDSVGPAVAQSTDTSFFNCESMLIDVPSFRITSLGMEYDYKSKTLMTAVVITQ